MFLFPIVQLTIHFGCLVLQVIRRLRDRGEPVRLFGETDYESYQRLKRLETLEPDVNKVSHLKKTLEEYKIHLL